MRQVLVFKYEGASFPMNVKIIHSGGLKRAELARERPLLK